MNMKVSNLSFFDRFKLLNKKKIAITTLITLISLFVLISLLSITCCNDKPKIFRSIADLMAFEITDTSYATDVAGQVNVSIDNSGTIMMGSQRISVPGVLAINTMLIGIATSVCIILWFPTLASSFLSGQAYGELLIKKMAILAISLFMVLKSFDITSNVITAGSQITSKIVGEIGTVDTSETNIGTEIIADVFDDVTWLKDEERPTDTAKWTTNMANSILNKLAFFWNYAIDVIVGVPIVLGLILPWGAIKIVHVMCSVFTISRAIEILVLATLSPIPFAIVSNEPLGSGTGSRFIKNMFALSIQGCVMLIIVYICTTLSGGVFEDVDNYWMFIKKSWTLIAIGFAEVTLLAKSLTISQKLFGLA